MNLKSLLPQSIKLPLKKLVRQLKDLWRGDIFRFARAQKDPYTFEYSILLHQPVKSAYLFENKIENIKKAGEKINLIVIRPGEIFSFWRIVGEPTQKNGFKKGRNLILGKMSEDYGGGLCQLSGILYHLSLIGGLEIVERYNHSVDFYTEENRYTPIGSDATVVYGYKDLRVRNNFNFPIGFFIEITNDRLTAKLLGTSALKEIKIIFESKDKGTIIEVVGVDENGAVLNTSRYVKQENK